MSDRINDMNEPLVRDTMKIFELTLEEGNDRTAAIMCLAHIEDMLLHALRQAMPDATDTLFKELTSSNSNGPLSSFNNRLKVLRALGHIDQAAYEDAERLGTIRNRFAHRLDVDSFEHEAVAGQIKNLNLPRWKEELTGASAGTMRYRFTATALDVAHRLHLFLEFGVTSSANSWSQPAPRGPREA